MSQLGRLNDHAPIDFRFPESHVNDAIETSRDLYRILRQRLRYPARGSYFLAAAQERALQNLRKDNAWDVFYSNSRVPRYAELGPVVKFDYIHEPNETKDPAAFARDAVSKSETAEKCTIVQVSTYAQKRVFQRIGVPIEKLQVVPFYLPDLEVAPRAQVQEKHARVDELKIVFIGHEARRKGLEALLEAIQAPILANVPLRLTIVSRFLDGLPKLPDDPRVQHHASLPHAEALVLIATAHVLAVPSRRETFGLVYLEAMAAGCICLMAAGPQQHEISDGGQAGLPIGPDPSALALALLEIYEDGDYRERMALAGLNRFCDVYCPEQVAAKHDLMFRSAIGESSAIK